MELKRQVNDLQRKISLIDKAHNEMILSEEDIQHIVNELKMAGSIKQTRFIKECNESLKELRSIVNVCQKKCNEVLEECEQILKDSEEQ